MKRLLYWLLRYLPFVGVKESKSFAHQEMAAVLGRRREPSGATTIQERGFRA
jgi:hypothetical protein